MDSNRSHPHDQNPQVRLVMLNQQDRGMGSMAGEPLLITATRAMATGGVHLADIVELMLATGARIGEILALRWVDVALDATRPNLTINGTIKTEAGRGTYRKASPESDASVRTVVLPDFAVAMLKRRQAAARANPNEAVFPTRNGTWQQVNNVERRWRQIRQGTGLDWVTPHTFRKTVATLISERVDAETASQQLGHPSPAITREFYISKPTIAADVAHILAEFAQAEPEAGPNTSGVSGE